MATKITLGYAKALIWVLKNGCLDTQHKATLVFERYINGIFISWQHSENDILQFIEPPQECHPTMEFTSYYFATSTVVVDGKVTISQGKLGTSIHRKPTDTQQ